MRLQPIEELNVMIKHTLECEAMLPEGYELEDDLSPKGVAAHTIYTMAHRILDLEADLAKFYPCGLQNYRDGRKEDCWEVVTDAHWHNSTVYHKDSDDQG
jgi:hypothetical protein